MDYAIAVYEFFNENWDQVREAAELLVAAWLIIGGLAPGLADRLRERRDGIVRALPFMRK